MTTATGAFPLVLLAVNSFLYAVLVVALTSLFVSRPGLRDRIGLQLPFYVLLSFLWTLGQMALYLGRLLHHPGLVPADLLAWLLLYALVPLGLLSLALTLQFLHPGDRPPLHRRWWIAGLVCLLLALALRENLPAWIGLSLDPVLTKLDRLWLAWSLLVGGWAVCLGVAAVLTVLAYRAASEPGPRNRAASWALALFLTVAGVALVLAGYRGWGSLLHLLGTAGAAYLLIAYRLPHVRGLARRVLSYLIVTLLLATLYLAGLLVAAYASRWAPEASPWPLALALALILVVVIHPVLDRLQKLLAGPPSKEQVEPQDPDRMVSEYGGRISNVVDLERLARVTLGLVTEFLDVRRGALYVIESSSDPRGSRGGMYRLHSVAGSGQSHPPAELSATSPLAEHLCDGQMPLTQYEFNIQPRFNTTPLEERNWLSGLNMDAFAPICTERAWVGLLALGPKRSGERYSAADLDLLLRLAHQTAVPLQNAYLVYDLQARLAETERRSRELAATSAALGRLNEGQSDLFGIACNEVRKSLASLQGYIDLLRELVRTGTLTPPRGEEMMAGISSAAQRLEEIAGRLLEVSQLDTGPLQLRLEETSLAETVQQAAATWHTAMTRRNLTFSVQGFDELPPIEADGQRLAQVLAELIQNAIKFTPDGGQIQVRGALRNGDRPPGEQQVEVVVADTGVGIARANLTQVFEPFTRAGEIALDRTGLTRFRAAGAGLGLSLARRVVEAHGGRIWAVSAGYDEKNHPGTEVHLVLPVRGAG